MEERAGDSERCNGRPHGQGRGASPCHLLVINEFALKSQRTSKNERNQTNSLLPNFLKTSNKKRRNNRQRLNANNLDFKSSKRTVTLATFFAARRLFSPNSARKTTYNTWPFWQLAPPRRQRMRMARNCRTRSDAASRVRFP